MLLACVAFFGIHKASALTDHNIVLNDIQGVTYKTIQANTHNFYSSTNKAFHIPNFLYGEPLLKPQHEESYEQMVDRFFQTYPELFQNVTIADFRVKIEQPKDRTITQVHLFQTYQGISVFGAELILTFNEQFELISYLGKYIPNLTVETRSTTKLDEIKQIVANDLAIKIITPESKLFIFNRGVLTDQPGQTHLAWRLATNGWVYFIDAHTKEIIYKYEDVDNALNRTVYSGGGGTPTLPGSLVISEGDDTSLVNDDAVAAYDYSEDVYNYFYGNFALDSYNDAGAEMISTVDYATSNLARWCNYLKIQDTAYCPDYQGVLFYAGYPVLDIVAHEWTHAVDDYAVQDTDNELYGLTMSEQSGALNESYSDIFGVLIEAEYGSGLDWDIGEDSPSGMFRNLADPTTSATPQPDDLTGYDDTQDSHYNSGVPNKAAYLIMREPSEGIETFNSTDVTGIGLDKAENIFYYALRDELITSATFDDNFNALLQTCLTLEVITIDTTDCESIFDAYTAIGVNTDSSYLEAAITTSTESGYAPLTVDFDGADSFALNATINDYVWDFDTLVDSDGDGDATNDSDNTGPIASHTYSDVTNTHARLTVTDDTLNSTYTSVAITVNNPIEPTFTILGDGVAAPATVSFDASATTDATGTITDYTWDFGDGSTATSTGTTPTISHTYASDGYYVVELTVTDDAGYSTTYSHGVYLGSNGVTTLGGSLSTDTWTEDHSPYLIDSNLTVAAGRRNEVSLFHSIDKASNHATVKL